MVSTRSKSVVAKPAPNIAKDANAGAEKKKAKSAQAKKEIKPKVVKKVPQKDQKPQMDVPKAKARPEKSQAKPVKTPSIKGYTPDQYNNYKAYIVEYKEKSNSELKDILRKNDQKIGGEKSELAERIADGVVLGAIPKCPNCGGGRPRFDYKKGTYFCPGYRDDVDFVNCKKTYSLADLVRKSWIL